MIYFAGHNSNNDINKAFGSTDPIYQIQRFKVYKDPKKL